MISKLAFLSCVIILGISVTDAQSLSKKIGCLIGFSMNATDFATPNAIKATSLGDTLKNADWQKFSITDFSISLMYREGFSNKIDLPARYNGLFIEYTGTGV